MQLQNYQMAYRKHVLMNILIYLTLKEVKWATNDHTNLALDEYHYSDWLKEISADEKELYMIYHH